MKKGEKIKDLDEKLLEKEGRIIDRMVKEAKANCARFEDDMIEDEMQKIRATIELEEAAKTPERIMEEEAREGEKRNLRKLINEDVKKIDEISNKSKKEWEELCLEREIKLHELALLEKREKFFEDDSRDIRFELYEQKLKEFYFEEGSSTRKWLSAEERKEAEETLTGIHDEIVWDEIKKIRARIQREQAAKTPERIMEEEAREREKRNLRRLVKHESQKQEDLSLKKYYDAVGKYLLDARERSIDVYIAEAREILHALEQVEKEDKINVDEEKTTMIRIIEEESKKKEKIKEDREKMEKGEKGLWEEKGRIINERLEAARKRLKEIEQIEDREQREKEEKVKEKWDKLEKEKKRMDDEVTQMFKERGILWRAWNKRIDWLEVYWAWQEKEYQAEEQKFLDYDNEVGIINERLEENRKRLKEIEQIEKKEQRALWEERKEEIDAEERAELSEWTDKKIKQEQDIQEERAKWMEEKLNQFEWKTIVEVLKKWRNEIVKDIKEEVVQRMELNRFEWKKIVEALKKWRKKIVEALKKWRKKIVEALKK